MSKRSRTESVPHINSRGLKKLSDHAKRRWDRLDLPGRTIQETKFAEYPTLEKLGLASSVEYLLNKVGLKDFLWKRARTYERYNNNLIKLLH